MGCFNVTCCVTKTPIVHGQSCHVAAFGPEVEKWLVSGECFTLDQILQHLTNIAHGHYDEYGGITNGDMGPEIPRTMQAFFVSQEAWTFGKTLIKEPRYRDYADHLLNRYRLSDSMLTLMAAIGKVGDEKACAEISKMRAKTDNVTVLKLEPDVRVLTALHLFCHLNHFNMLDPSFVNRYAGQEWHVKEKRQWMTLCATRIAHAKTRKLP